VTFWYAPNQHPNTGRISRTSSFVDSVATLFQIPAPKHLDLYITGSMEEAQRATGLDFFPVASADRGRGGRAIGGGIVLSGNPTLGEEYLHEVAHAILGPAFPSRNGLFNEGVATWLGGSRGRTTQEMYSRLHQIQLAHPAFRFSQVLARDFPDASAEQLSEGFYGTAALVVDAVYRRAGLAGLHALALLSSDPKALLAALPAQLGLAASDQSALDRWWRSEAAAKSSVR
jgi:hypothetical protein